MDPGSTGSANPYGAGSYTATTTPAPSEQLAQLDYQRTTAITALALANPSVQDTQHITLDRTEWHATQDGWGAVGGDARGAQCVRYPVYHRR